jgi:hypothetical protein
MAGFGLCRERSGLGTTPLDPAKPSSAGTGKGEAPSTRSRTEESEAAPAETSETWVRFWLEHPDRVRAEADRNRVTDEGEPS